MSAVPFDAEYVEIEGEEASMVIDRADCNAGVFVDGRRSRVRSLARNLLFSPPARPADPLEEKPGRRRPKIEGSQ